MAPAVVNVLFAPRLRQAEDVDQQDRQTSDRYIDPALHTMWAASLTTVMT